MFKENVSYRLFLLLVFLSRSMTMSTS